MLRHYMGTLEQDPEDLIGKDDETNVDEGHLYFGWENKKKKYKLLKT